MKPLTDKIIDQDSFIPDHAKIEETLAAISDDSDPEDSGSVRLDTHPEFRSKSTPSYGFQIHPELTNAADDEMDDVLTKMGHYWKKSTKPLRHKIFARSWRGRSGP